jgi:hypothetical protein
MYCNLMQYIGLEWSVYHLGSIGRDIQSEDLQYCISEQIIRGQETVLGKPKYFPEIGFI